MNKPRVDWGNILLKCLARYDAASKPAWFCRGQITTFEANLISEAIKRNRDARNGHGNPFPKNKPKKKEEIVWFRGAADLCCDDPYYDDIPVLG